MPTFNYQSRLKGHTLFIVLAVSFLIALISSMFILLGYLSNMQVQKNLRIQKVENNALSGANYLLADREQIRFDKPARIDLYNKGTDSVILSKKQWGLYNIGIAHARTGQTNSMQIFMYGYRNQKSNAYALYVADHNRPLSFCGDTRVKGTVFAPEAGIKRAYIEGRSYTGKKLVYGTTQESNSTLPAISKRLIKRLSNITQPRSNDRVRNELDSQHVAVSFQQNTLFYRLNQGVFLNQYKLKGNIVLYSSEAIRVGRDNQLDDIILAAPHIHIQRHFQGNLQAIALDSLTTGKHVKLKYPSALGLISTKQQSKNNSTAPFIKIMPGSHIEGTVFAYQQNQHQNAVRVTLQNTARVTGNMYTTGYAEIKGLIQGSLTCNKLILETPSSIYENHLLNARININALPEKYAGAALKKNPGIKNMIKKLE